MNLIDRVKNILITPNTEWLVIEKESPDIGTILTTYVLPLLALGAAAIFIGNGLIGYSLFGVHVGGIKSGLISAVLYVVLRIAGVFIVALVIDILAPSFESEKNWNRSFQLAAYSLTASYVGAVFYILPFLGILASLFSLYCIYTMYVGIPVMKKTAADKQVAYLAVTILVTIVAMVIIGLVQAGILRAFYGLRFI